MPQRVGDGAVGPVVEALRLLGITEASFLPIPAASRFLMVSRFSLCSLSRAGALKGRGLAAASVFKGDDIAGV